MKALDRKLLRDLRLMWSQSLTIALVVASGIGGFLTTLSAVDSLAVARDGFYAGGFYADGRFADVFAGVKRAPDALVESLQALPGIADVQTTTEFAVRAQIEGNADPIIGQLIGIDRRPPLRMNRITLRRGHAEDASMSPGRPGSDGALPVFVSEAFATAHALQPGARLSALVNGRQRALQVAGVALSPE
jgi:putative ABC transport system permease protein